MNIDTKRCREYAEMFSKLAEGTHVIEECHRGGKWSSPEQDAILVQLAGEMDYRHRLIEKPRTPQTVTVYVWKAANGSVFANTIDTRGRGYMDTLLRTIEVSLDDDATVPVNTAIPAVAAAKSGIDWNALPAEVQWVAMDMNGQWYGYHAEPYDGSYVWLPNGGCHEFDAPKFSGDWRESLQQRPLTP